jgi:hypothetical protein
LITVTLNVCDEFDNQGDPVSINLVKDTQIPGGYTLAVKGAKSEVTNGCKRITVLEVLMDKVKAGETYVVEVTDEQGKKTRQQGAVAGGWAFIFAFILFFLSNTLSPSFTHSQKAINILSKSLLINALVL